MKANWLDNYAFSAPQGLAVSMARLALQIIAGEGWCRRAGGAERSSRHSWSRAAVASNGRVVSGSSLAWRAAIYFTGNMR